MTRTALIAALLVCHSVWMAPLAQGGTPALVRQLSSEKQFDLALEELDEYLRQNPDDIEAELYRGVILTRQGRFDEAVESFARLAGEHPDLPEPYNNLAVLHAAQGRYDEARESLLTAIRLQPRYDIAHENLGDVYAKLASLAYDRAYQLNRDNERTLAKARRLTDVFLIEAEEPDRTMGAEPTAPDTPSAGLEPGASGESSPGDPPCYTIGPIADDAELERISAWLHARGAVLASRPAILEHLIGHRVFLPPLENQAAADIQIARMRGEGLEDIARISSGELTNAIALGVYRTEEAAEERARTLRIMGYAPEITPRFEELPARAIDVRIPSGGTFPSEAFATSFPGVGFEATSCE